MHKGNARGKNIQSHSYYFKKILIILILKTLNESKPDSMELLHKHFFVFQCCLLRSEWETTARHANTSHSRAGSLKAFQTELLHKPFGKKNQKWHQIWHLHACFCLKHFIFQFLDLLVCCVGFFLSYKKTHTPINRINTRCTEFVFTHIYAE